MSAFGLARQLGVDRKEAQAYMDRYFARYPGVQRYMDEVRRKAADEGFVETLFGRRLYLPDIRSRNPNSRQAAERTAINAPMQGSAADIIKRAMLGVDRWLQVESRRAWSCRCMTNWCSRCRDGLDLHRRRSDIRSNPPRS